MEGEKGRARGMFIGVYVSVCTMYCVVIRVWWKGGYDGGHPRMGLGYVFVTSAFKGCVCKLSLYMDLARRPYNICELISKLLSELTVKWQWLRANVRVITANPNPPLVS